MKITDEIIDFVVEIGVLATAVMVLAMTFIVGDVVGIVTLNETDTTLTMMGGSAIVSSVSYALAWVYDAVSNK